MPQRIILVTADPSLLWWKTLPAKKAEILAELGEIEGSNFQLDIEYQDVIPEVRDGRITHEWFDDFSLPYTAKRYDFVGFHMSKAQHKAWKIIPGLRGSALPTGISQLFYFWADENTKRLKLNQFVQDFLHEFRHRFMLASGLPDDTHAQHADGDIRGAFKGHKIEQYQKPRISFLRRLLASLQKPKTAPLSPTSLLPLVKRQADKFVAEMAELGLPIRITEGYRSPARQAELYAQGRTTPGPIVTNAKAGESFHSWGCAIDVVFKKQGYDATPEQWHTAAAVAEKLGFAWGGDWPTPDKPHFELTSGYSIAAFKAGKVDYSKFK